MNSKKWYISKNYKMTKKGFLKTGVEMLTRYLKENGKFVEAHRGQEDLDNEYNIFVSSALLRNDKKLLVNVSGLKALALAKPTKTDKKSKQYSMFIKQILEN
jgi:predicted NUDIX family phosphoesterase